MELRLEGTVRHPHLSRWGFCSLSLERENLTGALPHDVDNGPSEGDRHMVQGRGSGRVRHEPSGSSGLRVRADASASSARQRCRGQGCDEVPPPRLQVPVARQQIRQTSAILSWFLRESLAGWRQGRKDLFNIDPALQGTSWRLAPVVVWRQWRLSS